MPLMPRINSFIRYRCHKPSTSANGAQIFSAVRSNAISKPPFTTSCRGLAAAAAALVSRIRVICIDISVFLRAARRFPGRAEPSGHPLSRVSWLKIRVHPCDPWFFWLRPSLVAAVTGPRWEICTSSLFAAQPRWEISGLGLKSGSGPCPMLRTFAKMHMVLPQRR